MSGYIDSKTPRGPQRWLRALNNWEANPDSAAAQLFAERLRLARLVTAQYGSDWVSRAFFRPDRSKGHDAWSVDFYTCSAFCAAVQVQLEFSYTLKEIEVESRDALIVDYLRGDETTNWRQVQRRSPAKSARCQTCGRTITPDSVGADPLFKWPSDPQTDGHELAWGLSASEDVTPETHPATFARVAELQAEDAAERFIVLADGTYAEAVSVRELRLTDRERFLFPGVTDETRAAFAQLYGSTLA